MVYMRKTVSNLLLLATQLYKHVILSHLQQTSDRRCVFKRPGRGECFLCWFEILILFRCCASHLFSNLMFAVRDHWPQPMGICQLWLRAHVQGAPSLGAEAGDGVGAGVGVGVGVGVCFSQLRPLWVPNALLPVMGVGKFAIQSWLLGFGFVSGNILWRTAKGLWGWNVTLALPILFPKCDP